MNILIQFDSFFDTFRKTDLWAQMIATYENSPWHREKSVAVHTQMLLDWYMENIFEFRNDKQRMLSMVACVFHDVAKPMAEIVKFSEERGEYRAYHGHELLSARIWIDYAMTNMNLINALGLNIVDISNIALMLEHHVPFATKDAKKRKTLKYTFIQRMGLEGHQAWLDLLLSDQHGRISDSQEKKLADVAAWMIEWEQLEHNYV